MRPHDVFNQIYKESKWGYLSGPGSDPVVAAPWIDIVNSFLKDPHVKTVLDIGCGDGRLAAKYEIEGKEYVGLDVSSEALSHWQPASNVKLVVGDALTADLPESQLVLLKDVIQHLPTKDAAQLLEKAVLASSILLVCNDYAETNLDTFVGGYRGLNLQAPPFNLSATTVGTFFEGPHKKVIQVISKKDKNLI